jgi:diguanylate cyclase (GGDEF)-like protein
MRHRLGHSVPVIERILVLRDGLGGQIGTAVAFHSAENLVALPHGECSEESDEATLQIEFQERLGVEFDDFTHSGQPFGVLWISVDQAHELRKTHGANACNAMLEKVQHALVQGLRLAEKLGRWGDNEFLVLSHEHTPEMLTARALMLAGLARTADFRWWGDKLTLTVSIGVAQAEENGSLAELLERANSAMLASFHAGGNQVKYAAGGESCSPS